MPCARSWTVVSMSWRLTISCSGVPTLRHADTTDRYSDPRSSHTSIPRHPRHTSPSHAFELTAWTNPSVELNAVEGIPIIRLLKWLISKLHKTGWLPKHEKDYWY